jgi:potassium-transporting ATPase KdpC subunit
MAGTERKNGGSAMKEHVLASFRLLVAFTVLLGGIYPLMVWAAARLAAPGASSGSFVTSGGRVVGSSLVGQRFAAPGHFHGRPSAAGDAGYDATSSGGTNLAPTSKKLADSVKAAVEAIRKDDPAEGPFPADAVVSSGLGPASRPPGEPAGAAAAKGDPVRAPVPADAVTSSGSGLDPHISPANALRQTARIAAATGIPEPRLREMVARRTEGRFAGLFGEPRVNVLLLNLDVDSVAAGRAAATAAPAAPVVSSLR